MPWLGELKAGQVLLQRKLVAIDRALTYLAKHGFGPNEASRDEGDHPRS